MVCVGCGESPGVPLHPFESGSPICGWCLRLSRQRDDVRSSRTASTYGRAGYEYPPSVGRMLKWGFKSPTAPKKIKKNLLTNHPRCDTIKAQRGVLKDVSTKVLFHGVFPSSSTSDFARSTDLDSKRCRRKPRK